MYVEYVIYTHALHIKWCMIEMYCPSYWNLQNNHNNGNNKKYIIKIPASPISGHMAVELTANEIRSTNIERQMILSVISFGFVLSLSLLYISLILIQSHSARVSESRFGLYAFWCCGIGWHDKNNQCANIDSRQISMDHRFIGLLQPLYC